VASSKLIVSALPCSSGHGQPLGDAVDGDHPAGPEHPRALDAELPDRSAPPDGDRVARLDLGVLGGHPGGREDVGQEQNLLVRHPVRDLE
jgi:hypothetical protein